MMKATALQVVEEFILCLDPFPIGKSHQWKIPYWIKEKGVKRKLSLTYRKRCKDNEKSILTKCNSKLLKMIGPDVLENKRSPCTFKKHISPGHEVLHHIIYPSELKLTKLIGSGGFGCVYLGYYKDFKVAVKKFHINIKNDYAKEESFRAELNVLTLRHENIVRMFGASPSDLREGTFIVMEYAGDRSLQKVINDSRVTLDFEKRISFSLDIATALTFIHSHCIIHLDIKPANIIISPQDVCKLGDFGCSQVAEMGTGVVSPTHRSHLTGTFAYRAPELLRGEPPSYKADIYSLGITLWQMTSRDLPYAGENQHVVIFGVVAYNLRPKLSTCVDMNDPMEQCYKDLFSECWDGEAVSRPSALQLKEALLEWKTYL